MRVGVALGAGGAVGVAFHGGVLAALQEATGWDPRDAEVLVGTSAGSMGTDPLDARRRAMVSRLAHRATLDYLERAAARELLAGLTGQVAPPAGSPAA